VNKGFFYQSALLTKFTQTLFNASGFGELHSGGFLLPLFA
jgi:hypothetical protein